MHEALATPDILHIICDFLRVRDVRDFRRCCKAWAEVGSCHAFRSITFYLQKEDLDFLQAISQNESAARNVRWLTYVGATLDPVKKTFEEYCHYYSTYIRNMDKLLAMARDNKPPPPPPIKTTQLRVLYHRYEELLAQQEATLHNDTDIRVIQEAIARFPALQQITMSTDQQFYGGKTLLSPYDDIQVRPTDCLKPIGCRHLDSMFAAVAETSVQLKRLQAGRFSWRFFDKDPTALSKALARCVGLTDLELIIATDTNRRPGTQGSSDDRGLEVLECRRVMQTGQLRDFIMSLQNLKVLTVHFTWESERNGYPASLDDILMPKVRWRHLESLSLSTISCERQDLVSVLKKHKTTLKMLRLVHICLVSTSWLVLLPQIRKTLRFLEEASIFGELSGLGEDTNDRELFDLEHPDAAPDELRDAITEYLLEGGRCPLRKRHNTLSDGYVAHD